ncbi:MAG: 7TM diverse intracellular signaling domain-containing protein, partial [Pseudomonadota bacterium]
MENSPFHTNTRRSNESPYKRSRYHALCLIGLFAVCFVGLSILAQSETKSDHTQSQYLQRLSFLEDPAAALSATQALARQQSFQSTGERSLNFGLSDSVFWVWVAASVDDASQDLRLELGYPHLDQLDVYRIINGKPERQFRMGDSVPFGQRPVKDRTFVLPITSELSGQPVDLLLRVQSKGSIQLPIQVKTVNHYQLDDRDEQLMLGFYYGILLSVLAYNLLLAVGTREPVYGYYCAYAVFLSLFQFSQNGLAFEYLWQESTRWHQVSIPFFASMALLFCARFTQQFLNLTRQDSPRLYFAYQLMIGIFAILAVASFVADRGLIITLVSVAVSVAGIFMISTSYYLYLKGDDNAFYYLLAWTILLFGIVIYAGKTLGVVPENFITEYSVQIGSAIEMILLSYALADRFSRLRDENVRVHAEAKATLEMRVKQRTQELQQAMLQFEAANDQLAMLS